MLAFDVARPLFIGDGNDKEVASDHNEISYHLNVRGRDFLWHSLLPTNTKSYFYN